MDCLKSILTTTEAAEIWQMPRNTIQAACLRGILEIGVECRKSGRDWLVSFNLAVEISQVLAPDGLKCRFLLTIKSENNTLIAKQWKRVEPKSLASNEVLIKF